VARMSTDGLDDVLSELNRLGERGSQIAAKMAEAGADILENQLKKTATAKGHVKTGAMVASISKGRPKKIGNGTGYEIYARGTDSKGVRNATKAFVLHYGTSSIKGSHWVDEAEQEGEAAAIQVMEGIFDQMIQEGGG